MMLIDRENKVKEGKNQGREGEGRAKQGRGRGPRLKGTEHCLSVSQILQGRGQGQRVRHGQAKDGEGCKEGRGRVREGAWQG